MYACVSEMGGGVGLGVERGGEGLGWVGLCERMFSLLPANKVCRANFPALRALIVD